MAATGETVVTTTTTARTTTSTTEATTTTEAPTTTGLWGDLSDQRAACGRPRPPRPQAPCREDRQPSQRQPTLGDRAGRRRRRAHGGGRDPIHLDVAAERRRVPGPDALGTAHRSRRSSPLSTNRASPSPARRAGCKNMIASVGIHLIGEVEPATFRSSERRAPHNLYANTILLREYADEAGYPDEPIPGPMWEFGPMRADAEPAAQGLLRLPEQPGRVDLGRGRGEMASLDRR